MHDSDQESDDDSSQFSKPTKAPKKRSQDDSSTSVASAEVKHTRAPNWAKDEEECLVEKFLENREVLTADLKGSSGKGGKVTAEKKDAIWQQITDSINR